MKLLLLLIFLLWGPAAWGLECGAYPKTEPDPMDDYEGYKSSWWAKCQDAAYKLHRLELEQKYAPDILARFDARNALAVQLYMGRRLTQDEMDAEFKKAESLADREQKGRR